MLFYAITAIEFIFSIVVIIFLLRFYLSGGVLENTSQIWFAVHRLTNWFVSPLNYIMPRLWRMELSAVFAALFVTILQEIIIYLLRGFRIFDFFALAGPLILTKSLLLILIHSLQMYTLVIMAGVVISRLRLRSKATIAINYYCGRMLWPFRQISRPIYKIDISPFVALVFAILIIFVAINTLKNIEAIL